MKKSIVFISFISIIIILLFKKIESTALKSNFSWTFSKILPYSLLLIIGLILFTFIIRINFKNYLVKTIVLTLVIFLPFIIGFALYPIYEGDFSLEGQKVNRNASPSDFKFNGLMVVAIADCPYCFASIEKLKLIKKRNPRLNIDFVVCTNDKKYLDNYIKESKGIFNVRIANNSDSLALTAGWRFPTFIVVKKLKPQYLWSNDQFGVRAIDKLESDYISK